MTDYATDPNVLVIGGLTLLQIGLVLRRQGIKCRNDNCTKLTKTKGCKGHMDELVV